jgi:membrane protease YdiL (CAAX protease family)
VIDPRALDWLLGIPLDPGTSLYAFLVGVYVPIAATRTRKRLAASTQPIGPTFRRSAAQAHVLFLTLAFAVAATHGIRTMPLPTMPWQWLLVIPAIALGELLRWIAWTTTPIEQRRTLWVRQILPSQGELLVWTALSCLATISEEITYRGLLFAIVSAGTGSVLAGTLLTATSFGAAHAPQGIRGVITIGVLSLILQALVIATGSLLPAMVVHATANVVAGIRAPKRFRDLDEAAQNAAV